MPTVARAVRAPSAPKPKPTHASIVPADIRALPAYAALTPKGKADLEETIRLARTRKDGADFVDKIRTVLHTPYVKTSVEAENRAELQGAVEAAAQSTADRDAEERIANDPKRVWTTLGPKKGGASSLRVDGVSHPHYFQVDRSDPKNIVVRINVHLNGELAPDVKKLEDAIEKHLHRDDFTVDLNFVDRSGPDVFEVKTDPQVWTNAENWVGSANTLAHELMHLLELNDEYDYRSHASNSAMTMDERLYWLKVEAGRKPAPADAWQGIMTDQNNPVLERQVREVARLDEPETQKQIQRLRLAHVVP